MKGLVILLVVVLSSYKTSAQYFESHNLYATGGLVVGNYLGLAGSLNYISHEKYSIQLCYSSFVHEAKFLPSDYDPAFFYARLGLSQPRDQFNSIEVLVGRVIVIHSSGKMRLNLRAGLTYSTIIEPTNWQKTTYSADYGNYTYDFKSHGKPGVILKPEIEFPFFRFFGLGIAPFILMNTESIIYGVEFNELIGLVRKK